MSDGAGVATAGPRPSTTPAPVPAPAPRPTPVPTPTGPASSRAAGTGSAPAPAALGNAAAARAAAPLPAKSVSLAAAEFHPTGEASALATEPSHPVPVHLGSYARGEIDIARRNGSYWTAKDQYIPLSHPALEPLRAVGVEPMLHVVVQRSQISGYATLGRGGTGDALAEAIKKHSEALGWVGIDLHRVPKPENKLGPAGLRFVVPGLPFSIGKLLDGTLTFGVVGETIVFDGKATIRVAGQQGAVQVARDERGGMSITGDLDVKLGAVAAVLHACLDSTGRFDVRGKVAYQSEKFSGEITVVVADQRIAEQLAHEQLGVEAAEQPAAGSGGAAQAERTRLTKPVPVGWGTLNFAVSDWLAGTAKVIIDPCGHLTVIGDIAPPAEVELFKQRDYVKHLFKFEARASYGIPVLGNIFVFANIGMDALAKLGPGKLHQIKLAGRYSTNPKDARAFTISGTITISAFAGLRLRAEGGAGIEIVDHDLKVGVGIDGLAGVRGYVEATPTIGMRELGEPAARKTQFFIKGHLEIAAQPFVALSGDLFVDLDSPWWSPAPDKKWTWPIGSLEYPLPGEFGIGADLDYVLGSTDLPEIKFGTPSFDSSKFITDLVNDNVSPKSKGEQEKPGTWKEGEGQGEAPGAGEGAATAGGGAPATALGAAPAKGVGGRDQSGKPAPQTAAPGIHPPAHPPAIEHEGVPAPAVEKRWAAGMKDLGELAARSQRDPLSKEEVVSALAPIKERYGFTKLVVEARPIGDDWIVDAEMNPNTKSYFKRAASAERVPEDYRIEQVGFAQTSVLDRPDMGVVPGPPVALEFPNGARVWRAKPGGPILHEAPLGSSTGRAHQERGSYTATEHGRPAGPRYQRTHTLGQGTGFESPYGIFDAPAFVNLTLQNNGIEQFMRNLVARKGPNESFRVFTQTTVHPKTLRLQEITYEIRSIVDGIERDVASYTIRVEGTEARPVVKAPPIQFANNPVAVAHRAGVPQPAILWQHVNEEL